MKFIVTLFGFLMNDRSNAGDALELPLFILWMLATLACFLRGLFIFRKHRSLAYCCLVIALIQIAINIPHLMATLQPSRSVQLQASRPNTALEPTPTAP